MRYLALCSDYDGTLATDGRLLPETRAALERLIDSGRRVLLVTGRELDELKTVCPRLDLFALVIAENGALIFEPATGREIPLAAPIPDVFYEALREARITPLSRGRVIAATREPHHGLVLETIRRQGLELQVIFNKGAVMIVPAGVNKATGLLKALRMLGLSPHNAVSVGDAENDHALLAACECGVAVANALPRLKAAADFVTARDHGAGVIELIDEIVADDLLSRQPQLARHHVVLGTDEHGRELRVAPYGEAILVTGTSGSGKANIASGLLERLGAAGYRFCLLDPEGDYEAIAGAALLGSAAAPPALQEIETLLRSPEESAVLNLAGVGRFDRWEQFAHIARRLAELKAQTGRPHWIALDKAHHLLPAERGEQFLPLLPLLRSSLLVTVHPELLAEAVCRHISLLLAVGPEAGASIARFARCRDLPAPTGCAARLAPDEACLWRPGTGQPVCRVRLAASRQQGARRAHKYAHGDLGEERSFYFRGPAGALRLRARNLASFVELADGVDDDTWNHHLRQGDYSRWIERSIGDAELGAEVRAVEGNGALSAYASRERICACIEERYLASADRSVEL